MARGSWSDDFRNKYGFGDGSTEEERDFKVRASVVKTLNKTKQFRKSGVKAVEYNRSGFHNHCMVLLIPAKTTFTKWLASNEGEAKEPDDVDYDEIITQAYEVVS